MKLKVNETFSGFLVKRATTLSEINATLFEAEHKKSGARLLFLDREDENKTFSIAFKTTPVDSTGVFHIIEHSVLCGSEKYTTKEPFVELLKGSLNTFLNAMTFPDKTMYPVASRNDKDFLNLMSVYLDAVFHPAILKDPNIFRQEGWHYELESREGEMKTSGVVLNEMRGAFSSADEVATYHIKDMLYPDTCYKWESGGEPTHITDLTYEDFRASHQKYYHPSNSEIFLDGSVDLDTVLPYIDAVLSDYERAELNIEIADQPAISPVDRTVDYEIAPNESPENKGRLVVGFLASRFDEQEKNIATTILLDAIASTNESPLKKALIDSGLCEDVNLISLDSIKQNSVNVDFRNVKDGKCDELYQLFVNTVKALAKDGIDKKMLEASLNNLEFKLREKDFGTMPIGIIYAMTVLETSLYGGDPAQNLSYDKSFVSLREKLSGDYFEKLLLSLFVENCHRATLVMNPSATLGAERAEKSAKVLAEYKAALSDEALEEVLKMNAELKTWQQTPDSPEDVATIPQLKISDISADVEKLPMQTLKIFGADVLKHAAATNGIVYTDFYFDATDLTPCEIFDLRLLVSLMQNVKTASHSAIELQNIIKSELGSFSVSTSAMSREGAAKFYVTVSASALESKKQSIIDIVREVLYTSDYSDKEVAHNILRQMKMASDESFTSGGHVAGFTRATAYTNVESAILEYYSGYEAHASMKKLEADFDSEFSALKERLSALVKKVFTRARLTLSVAGTEDGVFISALAEATPKGERGELISPVKPLGIRREGIVIPAQASYAELAANLADFGTKPDGSLNVVRSLLSYGYLWGAVRVRGGAYGVGLIVRKGGNVGYYSFRDPTPARTVDCYKESSAFLRAFADSGEDITKFIIGAVGDTSPLMTPKLKCTVATTRFLRGVSYEDECKSRREMLETNADSLRAAADILDKIAEQGSICIVAGKDKLDTCEFLDSILEI